MFNSETNGALVSIVMMDDECSSGQIHIEID